MDNQNKIVWFGEYCKKCAHKSVKETEDPCNTCLTNLINVDSHKPTNFKGGYVHEQNNDILSK